MSLNTFGHLLRFTTWGESHGPALGAVVEMAIIRRFTRSPRLILTVATIGLSSASGWVSRRLAELTEEPTTTCETTSATPGHCPSAFVHATASSSALDEPAGAQATPCTAVPMSRETLSA